MTEELNDLVTGEHPMSGFYNMMSDGEDGGKVQLLRRIINAYKQEAKRLLLEEYPEVNQYIQEKVG
jgi:hypothetical protein